jgi:predicted metal-dependent phosphoesterase TrpH
MKLDLHVHTKSSFDSMTSLEKIVKTAEKIGLKGIAITDHDIFTRVDFITKVNVMIIPGIEVNTDKGDLVGLFVKYPVGCKNFEDCIKELKSQGAITVLPHPYKGHESVESLATKVDCIEVFNSRINFKRNLKAYNLALSLSKPMIASSDAHFHFELGSCCTEVPYTTNEEKLKSYLLAQFSRENLIVNKLNPYNKYLTTIVRNFKKIKP